MSCRMMKNLTLFSDTAEINWPIRVLMADSNDKNSSNENQKEPEKPKNDKPAEENVHLNLKVKSQDGNEVNNFL